MKSVFEREGRLLKMAGNKPLPLNGGRRVWLVCTGMVDVFAVMTRQGEPAGPRYYLIRARDGDLLLDVGGLSKEDMSVFATGTPGSEVLELGIGRFEELCLDPSFHIRAGGAIAGWVSGLSLGIRKEMPPKETVELAAGREFSVAGSQDLRPGSGVVWVSHLEGASYFIGRNSLPQIDRGSGVIPISDLAWLQSIDNARYRVLDTMTCLRDGSLWSGLERFHALVLDCLEQNWRDQEDEQRRRLNAKAINEHAASKNALLGLASILEPDRPRPVLGAGEKDTLLAACQLVGEKMGIVFKAPGGLAMAGSDPLAAIAWASRIRHRQVVLKGEWWKQDVGPLLGHMEEDKRPVALLPVSPGLYEVNDPTTRERVRVARENVHHLNPFAFTFYRPFPNRPLKGLDLIRFGIRGCRADIVTIILMATMGALLGMITPIATGIVFDTFIPDGARGQLAQIALILLVCAFATAAFDITKAVALLRFESKIDASIQAGVMDRLLSLPVPFFRDYTTGDLADRALGINTIRQIMSEMAVQTVLAAIFSLFNFALMFWYDLKLALVATGIAIFGVLATCVAGLTQVSYQRELSELEGKISGIVFQFISGISKLRLSGTEDRAFAVWAGEFGRQRKVSYKAGVVSNLLLSFNSAFPILSLMAIFACLTMSERGTGPLSTGSFLAFLAAYTMFQNALLQMSRTLISSLHVIPLYERAKPIIQSQPEMDKTKNNPGELSGEIEFSHVHFRYSSDGPLVLKDVSFHVRPGQFIALVGGSGSGKSTVLRLLLGFEKPESGTIYYDGQDLAGINIRDLRRQIGVVLQSGKIIAGDVFKNIVGLSSLTLDDAWEAAKMAGLEEDLRQMPMGMHTVLPPGGGTLSGGQRQRLMIARAIVRKPRLLFFDEATSALDNLTQSIVSRSLEKLHATRVVIAHRLSTIMHADHILVFDKGQICQEGNYEQLLDSGGLFAELAKRQLI
jgi:NHLM bacteriocin system ABC transporter ATP-binding protein